MKPTPAQIRAHALSVLRSREARRVRFSCTGLGGVAIEVGPETFDRVAHAIEADRIRMDGPEGMDKGANGQYDGDNFTDAKGHKYSGRFLLGSNIHSRIWDAIFIHEAVHASLDLTQSRLANADDEAAAYVASAMYCAMVGLPLSRWKSQMSFELKVRHTAFRALRSAAITRPTEIQTLRDALMDDSLYKSDMGTNSNPTFETNDG